MQRRIFPLLLCSLLSFLLAACQATPPGLREVNDDRRGPLQALRLKDFKRLDRVSRWSMSDGARIYIALPAEASLDEDFHDDLVAVFSRYFPACKAGTKRESFDAALLSAGFSGAQLLVYPVLRKRSSKLGFINLFNKQIRPNQMQNAGLELDISIFSVVNRQQVDALRFRGEGGFFTGSELNLLWPPLEAYLSDVTQY
ncbi:MAG: hypothetical protein KDI36_06545 [Pseudomonadales bacterium]|nr:hypothetical protein [Pseudomonadales bacterium]